MEIRKITSEERVLFAEMDAYAFGEQKEGPAPDTVLDTIDPAETIGCFVDGNMVAGLRNHQFRQAVRGEVKSLSGIGCVCSYPEHRNKGYVRELMKSAFLDMRDRKMSVSMLGPFRESYYAAFEYVTANSDAYLAVPLNAFLHYLREPAGENWEFERMDYREARPVYSAFMRETAPRQYHGYLLCDEISDAKWADQFKNKVFLIVKKGGVVQAVAQYRLKGFMDRGEMIIGEMIWRDIAGRNALFGFISRHRDQVETVKMRIPFGLNFYQWLNDTMPPLEMKVGAGGWMVRIIDPVAALADIPVDGEGSVTFALTDQYCSWNNGVYRLTSRAGRLQMERVEESTGNRMNIQGLTALLYGTLPTVELIARDWIHTTGDDVDVCLDTWFPVRPIFSTFMF